MNNRKTVFLSYAGLLLVAIIWGLAFAVVKSALDYMPPVYMMAFRFTLAAILISLVFIRRFRTMTKEELRHGITIGVFLFFGYLTQTIGCKYTTAGKNAFLTALYIILIPFLHWIFEKKRPSYRVFLAALIGITGIGFLSLNGDLSVNIGDVLTLVCGVMYAFQISLIDLWSKNDDPVSLAILQMITSAVLSIIAAPVMDGGFPYQAMRTDVILGMLYLGVLSTMVCFLLQTVCQKYTRPEPASLIMSSEAVFGVLGSVIFLGEVLSGRMITGCLLMTAAIVLAQTGGRTGNKES
ncbi:MAG: DMT family transporter [Lachnospiraceae bacterium]|nr:DMT family transporter [Lachnospiraceae bacterium]